MSATIITGKMGTGKGKLAVTVIRDLLGQNRRVVTNMDLHLDKLMPAMNRATVVRVPDKPSAEHLEGAGHGNPESYDEDRQGALVLDECGTWLNARTYQDKNRAAFLDWMIHSRKRGYDCWLICQDISQVDKQVREALVEHTARCLRFDKMRIPGVGWILKALFGGKSGWKAGYLPRMHVATKRLGTDNKGLIGERWYYKGDDLHDVYDTRQIFKDDPEFCMYSMLSAWHLVGRHMPEPLTTREKILQWFAKHRTAPAKPVPKPKTRSIAAVQRLLPADERVRVVQSMIRRGVM